MSKNIIRFEGDEITKGTKGYRYLKRNSQLDFTVISNMLNKNGSKNKMGSAIETMDQLQLRKELFETVEQCSGDESEYIVFSEVTNAILECSVVKISKFLRGKSNIQRKYNLQNKYAVDRLCDFVNRILRELIYEYDYVYEFMEDTWITDVSEDFLLKNKAYIFAIIDSGIFDLWDIALEVNSLDTNRAVKYIPFNVVTLSRLYIEILNMDGDNRDLKGEYLWFLRSTMKFIRNNMTDDLNEKLEKIIKKATEKGVTICERYCILFALKKEF